MQSISNLARAARFEKATKLPSESEDEKRPTCAFPRAATFNKLLNLFQLERNGLILQEQIIHNLANFRTSHILQK